MYSPTAHQPAAMPTQTPLANAWLMAGNTYARAPYAPRRYGNGRSMRQALIAAGYSIAATQGYLATQARAALAGKAVRWPNG